MLILMLIVLILGLSLRYGVNHFGNISFSEIVFTLNMPMVGADSQYFKSYFYEVLIPIAACLVIFFLGWKREWRKCKLNIVAFGKRKNIILFPLRYNLTLYTVFSLCLLGIIVVCANSEFALFDYIKNQMQTSSFIEENYIKPENNLLRFPEEKRNLVWIYMESAETTFQDEQNGGMMEYNLIPEMTKLAEENISFSQTDKISGAAVAPACGWTIAGLVAQTSGLPLKLFSYGGDVDNSMDKYSYFMPGTISLGEILENEGYHNVFMAGSDFDFGGRTNYFSQHGNYEIIDCKADKKDSLPEEYKSGWGMNDYKLYIDAKEEILKLAESEQPFNLSLITVDTHAGARHECKLCKHNFENIYWNTWNCASKQVYDFVQWMKEQDFYENTTIIITGDHCSMETDFLNIEKLNNYDKHNGGTTRKVYNAIINSAVTVSNENMKNREFTTLDYFPTALASLGVEIEGNRLGLGTNLFSGEKTLAEQYGYTYYMDELGKKSVFYDNTILYSEN